MGEKYPVERGVQSVDDMARQMRKSSAGNKLNRAPTYGEVSAELKAAMLDNVITQTQANLAKLGRDGKINRVDLNDLDAVREAADRYLTACKLATVVPSISGLSASLGYSRQWICAIAGKQTEVGNYLSALFAAIASILEQMALAKATDNATSIFVLKNGAVGMTDRLDVTAQTVVDPVQPEEMSADEIARRYLVEYKPDSSTDTWGMPYDD